jgi:hypothetical protein
MSDDPNIATTKANLTDSEKRKLTQENKTKTDSEKSQLKRENKAKANREKASAKKDVELPRKRKAKAVELSEVNQLYVLDGEESLKEDSPDRSPSVWSEAV